MQLEWKQAVKICMITPPVKVCFELRQHGNLHSAMEKCGNLAVSVLMILRMKKIEGWKIDNQWIRINFMFRLYAINSRKIFSSPKNPYFRNDSTKTPVSLLSNF